MIASTVEENIHLKMLKYKVIWFIITIFMCTSVTKPHIISILGIDLHSAKNLFITQLQYAVLPTVAINHQIREFWEVEKCKNRQFWPFGDILLIHEHIKMQ